MMGPGAIDWGNSISVTSARQLSRHEQSSGSRVRYWALAELLEQFADRIDWD